MITVYPQASSCFSCKTLLTLMKEPCREKQRASIRISQSSKSSNRKKTLKALRKNSFTKVRQDLKTWNHLQTLEQSSWNGKNGKGGFQMRFYYLQIYKFWIACARSEMTCLYFLYVPLDIKAAFKWRWWTQSTHCTVRALWSMDVEQRRLEKHH